MLIYDSTCPPFVFENVFLKPTGERDSIQQRMAIMDGHNAHHFSNGKNVQHNSQQTINECKIGHRAQMSITVTYRSHCYDGGNEVHLKKIV